MARTCDICAKGPKKAANRSHALNKTLRVQKPNFQKLGGYRVCTACFRTLKKKALAGKLAA